MNDWVVESPSFEEQLMNNRMVYLNQKGINEVVELIKNKDEEIERLNNIIIELEKWIDEYYKSNRKWYNTELSSHDKRYYEREYINTEAMLVKFDKQLKELKGVDKE